MIAVTDCICEQSSASPQRDAYYPGKVRPVIRTYSAPLPLTNPTFFQPMTSVAGSTTAEFGFDPSMATDPELLSIKQQIRNSVLQKSKDKDKKMVSCFLIVVCGHRPKTKELLELLLLLLFTFWFNSSF